MNKEKLNKLKALLLAATTAGTLSGCNLNFTEDENKKGNVNVEVELTEEEKQELIDKIANEINSRTTSKDEKLAETTTETTTTENKTETTSTTTLSETVYTQTFTNTTTMETTISNPIVTTETTAETTTTQSAQSEDNYEFNKIAFEFWAISKPYTYKDEGTEFTLGSEYPTVYSLARAFCPVGMRVNDFLNYIQEMNPNVGTKLGDIINVPVRNVYSDNELKYTLPIGTTEKQISEEYKIYLYNNVGLCEKNSSKVIPLSKNYTKNVEASFIVVRDAWYEPNHNTCSIVQIENDYIKKGEDEAIDYHLAENVKNAYLVDGIPVFEARTLNDCYQNACLGNYVYEAYATVATVRESGKENTYYKDPTGNPYYFYKDSNGNICFTFDKTDLTKYGYTKAPEVAKYFFRTERYYSQDETGIDFTQHFADIEPGLNAFIQDSKAIKKTK